MNRPASTRIVLALIAVLLVAHLLLSHLAVRTKSATFDETLHATAGYVVTHLSDYRLNPEDPPLWQYWATLPHGRDALKPPMEFMVHGRHWPFCARTLYMTPGVRGDEYLNTSRAMMLLWPAALVMLAAGWAWRLAGPVAAGVVACLLCLDPNLLGHSSLVKNDVPFTLIMLATALAIWHAGRVGGWKSGALCGLACGVGMSVKYSGTLLPPVLILALLMRSVAFGPWMLFGTLRESRGRKLLGAVKMIGIAALVAWLCVWATYRFRFDPTPNPGELINSRAFVQMAAENDTRAKKGGGPITVTELARWKPPLTVRFATYLESKRLMPQAWTAGLLYTYMSVQIRGAYLLGQYSLVGWWYYFPLAILFKTPTATLAMMLLAALAGVIALSRRAILRSQAARWTAAAIALPATIYFVSAVSANLNLGIRHMLPIYPILFMGVAWAVARLWADRRVRIGVIALFVGLGIESLVSYPNFLAFFNAPSSGTRGGLHLLGDSNLDWGQDLPLLAEWRRNNPNERLYVSYFGTALPSYYLTDYAILPAGWSLGGRPQDWPGGVEPEPVLDDWPAKPGIAAISATHLQGVYHNATARRNYTRFMRQTPIAVLGGSIYLYRYEGRPPGPDAPASQP